MKWMVGLSKSQTEVAISCLALRSWVQSEEIASHYQCRSHVVRGVYRLAWCAACGAVLPSAKCTLQAERGAHAFFFEKRGSFAMPSSESRHAPKKDEQIQIHTLTSRHQSKNHQRRRFTSAQSQSLVDLTEHATLRGALFLNYLPASLCSAGGQVSAEQHVENLKNHTCPWNSSLKPNMATHSHMTTHDKMTFSQARTVASS